MIIRIQRYRPLCQPPQQLLLQRDGQAAMHQLQVGLQRGVIQVRDTMVVVIGGSGTILLYYRSMLIPACRIMVVVITGASGHAPSSSASGDSLQV